MRESCDVGKVGPLQGVKVVSCSTAQAGTVPYMLMADLGADVIKIEPPDGGDGSRRMTVLPGMPSTFFETNNRGVKSVTLNLKSPEGRAILHKLVAKADIFGQNFRPERRREERLRLGGAAQGQSQARLCLDLGLRHERPQRPSARHRFDGAGAGRHRRGLFHAGPEDAHRHRLGGRRDLTAMLAFGGALAALTHARTTGVGQKIELSLLGSLVRLMGWTFTTTMWRDQESGDRPGAHHRHARAGRASAPRFNDRDGKPLVFQLTGPENWKDAMTALGFYDRIKAAGFEDLGVDHRQRRQARGAAGAARRSVRHRHARRLGGAAAQGRHRLGADQHDARGVERSRRASPTATSPRSTIPSTARS